MSEVKLYDVLISYPIQVGAENEDTYKGLYLEMINPSTGESHFEGVPNTDNAGWGDSLNKATVKAALTWRDNDTLIQSGNSWSRNAPNGSEYVKPIVLK